MMPLANGPAQCLKKSSECLLFFRREAQGSQLWVQPGVGVPTPVVELDVLEPRHPAVVHKGCRAGNLAKAGRLKLAAVFRSAGDLEAARVKQLAFPPSDASAATLVNRSETAPDARLFSARFRNKSRLPAVGLF